MVDINKKITVFTVQAFSYCPDGGNAAGVVLEAADMLSDSQMQAVAAEVGFSETAFVLSSDKADFRVRFFTPTGEVDLCGHATIATFYTMLNQGKIKPGKYVQETLAGLLPVEVFSDNRIMMTQARPVFLQQPDRHLISVSLNLSDSDLDDVLPVEIVSTGLPDIIVPVKSLQILHSMHPDFDKVQAVSEQFDVVGYHVFTTETIDPSKTAHCRNLAPRFGIPEEAATGTASGALSAYLFKHRLIDEMAAKHLVFEQGDVMGSPSIIGASLEICNQDILNVQVGGTACVTGQMTVCLKNLPPLI